MDVSIHFNAGAGDSVGNGVTTGTETYVYSASSGAKGYAEKVCAAIAALGFRNRGVKYSTGLYVLKNTKAPAMLIECCFVDDKDDVQLYDYNRMAEAIVYGITGQRTETPENIATETESLREEKIAGNKEMLYRVRVDMLMCRRDAEKLAECVKAAGFEAGIVKA